VISLAAQLDGPKEATQRALTTEAVPSFGARFLGLVERELDRSYRLAGLLLGDAAEAEDAVGDALERAWRDLHTLRDLERFQSWFDRIVVNCCRDRLRRRNRVRFVALESAEGAQAADPFRDLLDGDATFSLVRDLMPEEREIVILHFWADLTLESVAERLDVRIGTVKSRLHRALVRMRDRASAQRASELRR
jgi:RNA polymerase sigma-70 factor, ECF subfamily